MTLTGEGHDDGEGEDVGVGGEVRRVQRQRGAERARYRLV